MDRNAFQRYGLCADLVGSEVSWGPAGGHRFAGYVEPGVCNDSLWGSWDGCRWGLYISSVVWAAAEEIRVERVYLRRALSRSRWKGEVVEREAGGEGAL